MSWASWSPGRNYVFAYIYTLWPGCNPAPDLRSVRHDVVNCSQMSMKRCEKHCNATWTACYRKHGLKPGPDYGDNPPPEAVTCNHAQSHCVKKCNEHECSDCKVFTFGAFQDAAWWFSAMLVVAAVLVYMCTWRRRRCTSGERSESPRRIRQAISVHNGVRLPPLEGVYEPLLLDEHSASSGPPIIQSASESVADESLI